MTGLEKALLSQFGFTSATLNEMLVGETASLGLAIILILVPLGNFSLNLKDINAPLAL